MPLSPVLTAVGVGGVGPDAAGLGVAPLRQPVSRVVATATRMRIRTVRTAVTSSSIGYHTASAHAAAPESVCVLNIGQVVLSRRRLPYPKRPHGPVRMTRFHMIRLDGENTPPRGFNHPPGRLSI